jgi:hypothetical protein
VTHDAVLLENLTPVEQRAQQSMGIGRIYGHAKADGGEKGAETQQRVSVSIDSLRLQTPFRVARLLYPGCSVYS